MAHWLRQDYNFSKGEWYRPYSSLNSMPLPPSPQVLKEIQINAIKANNAALTAEIDHLNSFLNGFQEFAKSQVTLNDEQDFFGTFLKKINRGYGFFDMSDMKNPKPTGDLSWLDNYITSVKDFTNVIQKYTGKEIPANITTDIERMRTHIENGNFYGFRRRKSQLWEDLAEWILNVAGFKAIGTGAVIDKAGKQLVQDVVAYLPSQLKDKSPKTPKNGLGMAVRYTGTSSQKANKPLEQWAQEELSRKGADQIALTKGGGGYVSFNVDTDIEGFHDLMGDIQQHSLTKKVTVKIDDPTQDYLSKFLSVQAKSGSNQDLLNNQKRDMIDIVTLSAWDKYINTLNKFYNNFSQVEKVDEGRSETLSAYTNWVFSKNIAKSTLGKNTFFLSQHGFTTLDKSMIKDKFYFKLAPNPNSLKLLCSTSFTIEEENG